MNVADMNGDSVLDLAVINQSGNGTDGAPDRSSG